MKAASNNKNKIFFAFTDAHPRDRATNSIYFMMYKDGKLCGADGRVISDKIQPVSPGMADKVYDATKHLIKPGYGMWLSIKKKSRTGLCSF